MYDVTITNNGDNMDVSSTYHFETYKEAFEVFSQLVKTLDTVSKFNMREVVFCEMDPAVRVLMYVTDIDYNA